MREIKFRGMDIKGNWHYGNLAILPANIRHLQKGHYISNDDGLPFAFQVRPETVGEYTGLKDRNGREIYEGDIVHRKFQETNNLAIRKVVFQNDGFKLQETGLFTGLSMLYPSLEFIEVIGNIYENPELLP